MPPETFGATAQPLFDLPPVERTAYSGLADAECERVQRLVVELMRDRQTFTAWRDLMCALVAAEVATRLERMTSKA